MMVLLFWLSPLAAAAALLLLNNRAPRIVPWVSTMVAAFLFFLALTLAPAVAGGEVFHFSVPWVPGLGVSFSFWIEGFSLLFTLLITGMGALILFYSREYMAHHEHRLKFYCWMLVFMAAMLGLVQASNLIIMYLFWEFTSISSFFLIGLNDREEAPRWNATMALLITTAGSLAMLAGIVLLYQAAGTLELPELWEKADALHADPLLLPILVLLLAGAFTKSAMLPFHIWLPAAMVAPTPVSAYLHSATMVKAGVFLVARLTPLFQGVPEYAWITLAFGLTTMIAAGLMALRQHDLKGLLAYSTISHLGLLVAMFGQGTDLAVKAATVHLVSHAIFKGAMFLVAGAVEHQTHTRDLRELGGLARYMPASAAVAILAALSAAGIPPLLGFVSKEVLFEGALHLETGRKIVAVAAMTLGAGITFAYSLRYVHGPFFAKAPGPAHRVKEVSPGLLISPAILGVLGLALGVYPGLWSGFLVGPAVQAILQNDFKSELHLWQGVNAPLVLSMSGLGLGVLVYLARHALATAVGGVAALLSPARVYTAWMHSMYDGLPKVFRHLQNGNLTVYIAVIILAVSSLLAAALARSGSPALPRIPAPSELGLLEYALVGLLVAGAVAVLFQRERLAAMLTTSIVGLAVVLIFVVYSAPDLALTQLLVELLLAVIFVLGLKHMLGLVYVRFRKSIVALQVALSLALGVVTVLAVLAVLDNSLFPSIADYYVRNAYPLAGGKNIVNLIVIDFRAFDTLGEITVVAVAALATVFIMRLRRERR